MKQNIKTELNKIIGLALDEDRALNDVTSDLTIPKNHQISFAINSREEIILCGVDAIKICFDALKKSKKFADAKLKLKILAKDGDVVKPLKSIAEGYGDAKLIFAAERVILNLLQHLSGVATITNQFAKLAKNTKILDTRKTIPTLRALEKYAVATGGGENHRLNLSDMILIKDNHIAAAGGIAKAILAAKKSPKKLKIEVECDNLQQVAEAVKLRPNIIMLDNMNALQIKQAQKIIDKKCLVEISGGINLSNIKNFANLGADFISIGALTHSTRAVDIGLDITTKS